MAVTSLGRAATRLSIFVSPFLLLFEAMEQTTNTLCFRECSQTLFARCIVTQKQTRETTEARTNLPPHPHLDATGAANRPHYTSVRVRPSEGERRTQMRVKRTECLKLSLSLSQRQLAGSCCCRVRKPRRSSANIVGPQRVVKLGLRGWLEAWRLRRTSVRGPCRAGRTQQAAAV